MNENLEKNNKHFLNWYLIQTLATSVLLGYVTVDKAFYKGFDLFMSIVLLSVCYFTLLVLIANDFSKKDAREQRQAELRQRIMKRKEKRTKGA